MPEQIYIPVEQIDPNPYQTRFEYINALRRAAIEEALKEAGIVSTETGKGKK